MTQFRWKCIDCNGLLADAWNPCSCGGNECFPFRLIIKGNPVSQKNSKQIIRVRGRPFLISDKPVRSWHDNAKVQLITQALEHQLFRQGGKGRRLATILFCYLGPGQALDSDNLAAAPLDALKHSGIVANDYWCSPLVVFRESDRENPRVEIYLAPYLGSIAKTVEAARICAASGTVR